MSDSESESDFYYAHKAEIEQTCRGVVREATKPGDLTINIVRTEAEKRLGLEAGFLKENENRKYNTTRLIHWIFKEESGKVEKKSPEPPKKKSAPKPKAGTKRKSNEEQNGKKKRKKSSVAESEENEDDDGVLSDEGSLSTSPPSDKEVANAEREARAAAAAAAAAAPEDDDDSDMSVVLDDPPPKKKRQTKKSTSPAPKSKSSKSKPEKPKQDLSPSEEEIKRLQSQLLKCGIRKLWHRELAPYPTPKEKIGHLKQMLEDVGMSGRFSAEKARQIKEARELKAELEAATEFNEQWGQEKGEEKEEEEGEEEEPKRSRGLRPKGLVDLGESDGESE